MISFQRFKSVFNLAAVWVFQMVLAIIFELIINISKSSSEGNRVANPGEFKYFCLLEWSSVLKCIHLPAGSEFTVACSKHLLSLLQRELMTDVYWAMWRPTHFWDNGLEHMLSPVSGSFCNKGLKRDQASRECCQQAFVGGKSCPINLISFLGQW